MNFDWTYVLMYSNKIKKVFWGIIFFEKNLHLVYYAPMCSKREVTLILLRERPLMTSHVFGIFGPEVLWILKGILKGLWRVASMAHWTLPTYLALLYNVQFWGLSWTHLPILISDVINGRFLIKRCYFFVLTLLRVLSQAIIM